MSNQIAAISVKDCTDFWLRWQKHQNYLYDRCLKWMGGNPTEAEEALSQAMLKAWEKQQQYVGKITNYKGWLTRLTHNLCVDIHRQRSISANRVEHIEGIGEEEELVSFDDTPILALETDEKRMAIRHAIDNLPKRLRETFILHFYQQLSHQEIAEEQRISYQNVCKRISQARAVLREELREYFIGEDETNKDSSVTPPETESVKTDVEGRRKKQEGWNSDGDLNPNPIKTPLEDGEFNPYLDVKEEILVSVGVEEVKESEENSQQNLEINSNSPKNSDFANHPRRFEMALFTLRVIPILDLGQFHGEFVNWGISGW